MDDRPEDVTCTVDPMLQGSPGPTQTRSEPFGRMERDLSLYPSTDAGIGCKNLASRRIFDEYLTGALNLF